MMRHLLPLLIVALCWFPATAGAAKRCSTAGKAVAQTEVVKVFKWRSGSGYRFHGCARPNGIVIPLTQAFKGTQVKIVAKAAAFIAFTRYIGTQQTIAVVDARTGRKRHGLYPPSNIEFDIDPGTPQIGAAKLNERADLAVAYLGLGDGSSRDAAVYLYAFDSNYNRLLLDRGPSSIVKPSSLAMKGRTVSWAHGGLARSARLGGRAAIEIESGGGPSGGTVTTTPDGGISCTIDPKGISGGCLGTFAPGTQVTITATGPANATVTISGACSATHAPVAGETASVASCATQPYGTQTVKVAFG